MFINWYSNRYRLHFEVESQKELDQRKHDAKSKPLIKVAEVTIADIAYNDVTKIIVFRKKWK